MALKKFVPRGSKDTCRINRSGQLSIPRQILDDRGWQLGETIEISYVESLLIVLLKHGPAGYKLAPMNKANSV